MSAARPLLTCQPVTILLKTGPATNLVTVATITGMFPGLTRVCCIGTLLTTAQLPAPVIPTAGPRLRLSRPGLMHSRSKMAHPGR